MFEKTSEFIEEVFPGDLEPFYDPRELTDCKVGFSIKRKYPENIRFKPAKTSTGEHDSVAAIWVVYVHNKSDRDDNVPVTFRVETLSIYRSKHFDVDFDDPAAPTQNSLEQSNASPQPIGVEFNDDYYFDHENNTFKDKKGREFSGKEILEKVFEIHCNTIHFFKGIKIQAKLLWQSKIIGVLSIIISSFEFLLKKVFGRTFESTDSLSAFYKGYEYSNFKKLNEDSLNVFGYKAAKSVIILFSAIIFFVAFYRYKEGITGGYLGYAGKSNFLSLTHALLLIWVLDAFVPYILFKLVNLLIWLRVKIMYLKFKVG